MLEDKIGLKLFVLFGQDNECLCQSAKSASFFFKGILEINIRIFKIHDFGKSSPIFNLVTS